MFKTLDSYAWPGGYQISYVTRDNRVLCPYCAMVEQKSVTKFIHWEGEPIECDRCDKIIESEYGPIVKT